jgi:hypothetical protein
MNLKSTHLPALCGVLLLAAGRFADAQNPNLAPQDIAYSRDAYHLVAWADLAVKPGQDVHFQFDRYKDGDIERVKTGDGTAYARKNGGKWLKSGDWGDTGTPVDDDFAAQLDTDARVAQVPFLPPTNHDPKQGGTVWKFISQSQDKDVALFVYEESRENPNPGGVYPLYTFEKWPKDQDGSLLLGKVTGQLRSGDGVIPFTVQYDYLVPLPPDSTVKVFPAGKPPVTITIPPATNQ